MKVVQINKFSKYHNGDDVIFCHIDKVPSELNYIKHLGKEIIFISGNGDFCVDERLASMMPDNIKFWFAQNLLVNHPKIQLIPIGLTNTIPCGRDGHGVSYNVDISRLERIFNNKETNPYDSLVYSCFNIWTNYSWRSRVYNAAKESKYITIQQPNVPFPEFTNQIIKHRATLCPLGNLGDNHRIYEVLYCRRIPIIFKQASHAFFYEHLYKNLPVVALDEPEELLNRDEIEKKIIDAEKKTDYNKIDMDVWDKIVTDKINENFLIG